MSEDGGVQAAVGKKMTPGSEGYTQFCFHCSSVCFNNKREGEGGSYSEILMFVNLQINLKLIDWPVTITFFFFLG